MLALWGLTFWRNLADSLLVVALIAGCGGVFDAGAYKEGAIAYATLKQLPRYSI